MNLRRYQDAFVKTIAQLLTQYRKIIAQLATGGGKTVVFAAICHRYLKQDHSANKTVLILVHRKELLQQTRNTCYHAFKITCQPVIAGMKHIPQAQVYVGMVETVNRILNKKHRNPPFGNVGILIVDEAHRLEFMKILDHFSDCYIIGFSATPVTASKKRPLRNFYDEIVCGVDIPELIADGNLCQNITRAPKDTVDRLALRMKGNEFDERMMGDEFKKVKYVQNTVNKYKEFALGTKTLVFNVNISHSLAVTKAFIDAGYKCRHVDGEMTAKERDDVLKWFHDTPDGIMCNVGITTTGYDEPTIETVIPNKSTASMPLWLQMTGRGSRPIDDAFIKKYQSSYPYDLLPKSVFTIIDMGGNAITHGDWCQSRDWFDLFHNPLKPGRNTVAPIKVCPQCEAVIAAATRVCPLCGYVYPDKAVSVEFDLHEFIVVTKNIDVDKIIEENKHKKEYFPFFKIGSDLADKAIATIPVMTDEYAEFVLSKYHDIARVWMKTVNRLPGCIKRKAFTEWHKTKAREHLYSELKQRFPNWTVPTISPPVNDMPIIHNLEMLKNVHYEL